MEVGKHIRDIRKKRLMKQSELAECINVKQGYISKIESGKARLSRSVIEQIARCLDVHVSELLDSTEEYEMGQRVLNRLYYHYQHGEYTKIHSLVKSSIGAEYFKNPINRLQLFIWKIVAYNRTSEYEKARKLGIFIAEHPMFDQLDDNARVSTYNNIGHALYNLNQLDEAEHYLDLAHLMCDDAYSVIDYILRSRVMYNIGKLYISQNKPEKAIQFIDHSLKQIQHVATEMMKLKANMRLSLGNAYYTIGDREQALYNFKLSHKWHIQIGDVKHQLEVLNSIAYLYKMDGKSKQSQNMYRHIVQLIRKHPHFVSDTLRKELSEEGYDLG